ncbi:uncharacterized protein LOC128987808 [Macrosteles quadrilineatus]|uniref:uncharacterized protein LOC128987808 n=1 Tax=Macrosteles quadrilineatus TaxID=74068 RepID=UPI0023E1F7E9|nr:uncharacterized protein LOC128987808 [Macrosteles quadrilineatus]
MEEPSLLSLPQEVLIHIGSFLDLQDLLACSGTCSQLRSALNDNWLWRRQCRPSVISYINTSNSIVSPAFQYTEIETLEPLCLERINLLRQNHLLSNWRHGRSVNHEAQTSGNGIFLENNDRQIIYDNIYLFLHVMSTNEINIWNIENEPYLYTTVTFNLYEYNMEDEDWTDIVRVWYQIVGDKLVVIQGNLIQVYAIHLPNKDVPLNHLISIDRDAAVLDFQETLYTDCYSWIVGHLLFSRLCYLPVVHVWDITTGEKIRALRAPTTGWDLYVISLDDVKNVIFSLRTDDPFSMGPEDYSKITNHISSYNVAKDEFTPIYPNLAGCKPVHAMHYRSYVVLFCIDDMFIFICSIYVYDFKTCTTVAHRTFSDLVGLYKSRIVEDRLVLASQSSIDILDFTSLNALQSLKIEDIIDIDYFPVFSSTFIVTSSVKSEIEVWDINKSEVILKIPLQSFVFLNDSCSKLVVVSGQKLLVKTFW